MEIKAVSYNYDLSDYKKSIFLAGSIDNGDAEEWQKEIVSLINSDNYLIFNPRRDNWNKEIKPETDNDKLREQVEWELYHIDIADTVIFYFAGESKAPISLLELGLCLGDSKDIIIYCSDKFYRKGNVNITAEKYNQKVFSDKEKFMNYLREKL